MHITVRPYKNSDLEEMLQIWNQTVAQGISFPQEIPLTIETGTVFFLNSLKLVWLCLIRKL